MRLPIPNPNPKTYLNPNPIFNPNRANPILFLKENKRHRNIGQHRVIFTGYFTKGRGRVYQRHISES